MESLLQISERRAGDVTVLDLSGPLVAIDGDLRFCARADALVAAGARKILLNLGQVTSLDSGGVGALVRCYVRLRKLGGNLKLTNLTERTRRVLSVTRLLTVIEAYESEPAALASFATGRLPDQSTGTAAGGGR